MHATGIIRRVDDLGRIVIPREIRHRINIKEGQPLEVFFEEDRVMFVKYHFEDYYINAMREIRDNLLHDNDFDGDPAKYKAATKIKEAIEILKRNKGENNNE